MKLTEDLKKDLERELADLNETTAWDAILALVLFPIIGMGALVLALLLFYWMLYVATEFFDRFIMVLFIVAWSFVAAVVFYFADVLMSVFFDAIQKLLCPKNVENPENDPLKTENGQGISRKDEKLP